MADLTAQRTVYDARDLVANYPWHTVKEPTAASGAMTHEDGRPMTRAEIDEWLEQRLAARRDRA